MPHAVPDISASRHNHLLGSPRVVVQNSPASGVHTLDHQMIQHHFLLGPLNDLLLYRTLCDQAVNIYLKGKKKNRAISWTWTCSADTAMHHSVVSQRLVCWHCLFIYRCGFLEEKQAHSFSISREPVKIRLVNTDLVVCLSTECKSSETITLNPN